MCAVVFTYSFDTDAQVFLFLDEIEAKQFLKSCFEEEYRIEFEENEWDVEAEHEEDWSHAKITHYGNFGEDVCEYHFSHSVENKL